MARLIDEHNPRTSYQEITLARLIETQWRLRDFMKLSNHELLEDAAKLRARGAAEQSVARAEASWLRLKRHKDAERKAREPRPKPSAAANPQRASGQRTFDPRLINPTLPPEHAPLPDYKQPPELPDNHPIDWRNYIHLDPAVSTEWPVLKGTTVTAELVAAGLLEGLSIEQLLHNLPFLNRTQIRAAALCDAESACGPIEPG